MVIGDHHNITRYPSPKNHLYVILANELAKLIHFGLPRPRIGTASYNNFTSVKSISTGVSRPNSTNVQVSKAASLKMDREQTRAATDRRSGGPGLGSGISYRL